MTSNWKAHIGKTWAVQLGQEGRHPAYRVIDTDDLEDIKKG